MEMEKVDYVMGKHSEEMRHTEKISGTGSTAD